MIQSAEKNQAIAIELGIWLFILLDMCIFALYFWVFAWDKSQANEIFILGQASLNTLYGAINTVALLVSSYFIACAVEAARANNIRAFKRGIQLSIICGLTFLGIKLIEYSEKIRDGYSITTNTFYRDYYAFTGFHMLHVIIGLSLLAYMLSQANSGDYLSKNIAFIEGSALYWHMVDLVWVILFALIYWVV